MKLDKPFKITTVCKNDLIQVIEQQVEENKQAELIAEVKKLSDRQMRTIGAKMAGAYCDCCFWQSAFEAFLAVKQKIDDRTEYEINMSTIPPFYKKGGENHGK